MRTHCTAEAAAGPAPALSAVSALPTFSLPAVAAAASGVCHRQLAVTEHANFLTRVKLGPRSPAFCLYLKVL